VADKLTTERRSWNMSRVRSKDTGPELIVRSLLHKQGFRFRLHRKGLPGKPDIVLPKYKTVIFVHGCFWHSHPNCSDATVPKSRTEFWVKKFEDTVKRDANNQASLLDMGWKVIVIWECETVSGEKLKVLLANVLSKI
jgi:DNA mismatch endonuclease (patch repair protein)